MPPHFRRISVPHFKRLLSIYPRFLRLFAALLFPNAKRHLKGAVYLYARYEIKRKQEGAYKSLVLSL